MEKEDKVITLFLCGDVMTGRGIDQTLPHPSAPHIHEDFLKSALGYVELAEETGGVIPRPVDYSYIWGDALGEFERMRPDLRLINLETAVTTSEDWEDKGINYRMNPENIACLSTAGVDGCSIANNHVLDWGCAGLIETLEVLRKAGIKAAGAGRDMKEAGAPAALEVHGKGITFLFAFGTGSSGIPPHWAATEDRPGVNLLGDLSGETVKKIGRQAAEAKRPGDVAVASIHWGGNWGYEIPQEQRMFARGLIDEAGIDIVHGHSSHHVKGIEVYRGKLILYGCGDFINDYEGISGHEHFSAGLGLMYFVTIERWTGRLVSLRMTPVRMKRFRVTHVSADDAIVLCNILNREGETLGTSVRLAGDNSLHLQWQRGG